MTSTPGLTTTADDYEQHRLQASSWCTSALERSCWISESNLYLIFLLQHLNVWMRLWFTHCKSIKSKTLPHFLFASCMRMPLMRRRFNLRVIWYCCLLRSDCEKSTANFHMQIYFRKYHSKSSEHFHHEKVGRITQINFFHLSSSSLDSDGLLQLMRVFVNVHSL